MFVNDKDPNQTGATLYNPSSQIPFKQGDKLFAIQMTALKYVNDSLQYYPLFFYFYVGSIGVLSALGLFGNSLNLLVYRRHGFTESMTISLFALSICDSGTLIFLLLEWIIRVSGLVQDNAKVAFMNDLHQVIGVSLRMVFTRMSVLTTAVIALERCVGILTPHKVKLMFTPKVTAITLTIISFVVVLGRIDLYMRVDIGQKRLFPTNFTRLSIIVTDQSFEFTASLTLAQQSVSVIIIVVCNILLLIALKKRGKKWAGPSTDVQLLRINPTRASLLDKLRCKDAPTLEVPETSLNVPGNKQQTQQNGHLTSTSHNSSSFNSRDMNSAAAGTNSSTSQAASFAEANNIHDPHLPVTESSAAAHSEIQQLNIPLETISRQPNANTPERNTQTGLNELAADNIYIEEPKLSNKPPFCQSTSNPQQRETNRLEVPGNIIDRQAAEAQNSCSSNNLAKQNRRVAKMVMILSAAQFIAFMPTIILVTMGRSDGKFRPVVGKYSHIISIMWAVVALLDGINASTNILVYYNMSSRYRHTLRKMVPFGSVTWWRQRTARVVPSTGGYEHTM